MNHRIIEKYFAETCTADEAEQVLEWFATSEGQDYLKKRLEADAELLQDERIAPMLPDLDSQSLWSRIEKGTGSAGKYKLKSYPRRSVASYWYAAAVVIVICTVAVYFSLEQFSNRQPDKNKQPIHFITSAGQQKTFTLRDGTKIKLNSNSQLWIPQDYGRPSRDITLKGEAYFEVQHNQDQPFTVHTHGALVKDIGTAFDVRALPGEDNIQVAVKEGEVSFVPKQRADKQTVKLTRGQFGYLNLTTDSISIDTFAITNYLSWMNNRFKFENASLQKVSKQLSRIYNISFEYTADSLKAMTFSADFERSSLQKALDVISLTLSIDYQIKNHRVVWGKKGKKQTVENDYYSNRNNAAINKTEGITNR